ncbi:hypothetical protein PVAP13_5KG053601 [Panicum virgatum]|uniref:Uncharacterized protein n=1 Tax=Panicum virgatum TaxID=38727 RepID=A0A8T0SAB7_PANVG|nr:hypothetical protein PVAP13_5KG053601 [Panicum virgatum]
MGRAGILKKNDALECSRPLVPPIPHRGFYPHLCREDASLRRLSFPLCRPAPQHQQPLSILPTVAMAADGRMRCRSKRMQGRSKMTSASGAEQMKPHHGIRGLVKSGGGNSKSGDRRIETHGGASGSIGHIVKPGAIDSEIKPSSADSAKDAWIYIRGCRIKRVVILD